ncbi:MAG: divalent-cation tolerance protein CutA [Promethearchaeia archaeon]
MNFIFFVTVPSLEEGKKIGREMVENRLAACVNIAQDIHSIYRWKGKVEVANEVLLIMKTTGKNAAALIEKIEKIHPYETPECVGFPIKKGSEKYLKWLEKVVK